MKALSTSQRIHLWALASVFIALVWAKLHAPREFVEYLRSRGWGESAAWLAIAVILALESALALSCLVGSRQSVAFRLAIGGAVTFGVVTLTIALLSQSNACGCFGKLAEATKLRRAIVSLGILYLSLGSLAIQSGPVTRGAR